MNKYRALIVGCGIMAKKWVEYVVEKDDAQIVGLVDINLENARNFAQKYNLNCDIFKDIEEAIKTTGANLVLDVTIPEVHRNITIKSLALGCDVLGEKPMANSLEYANEMVIAAQKSGKTYAVMQNRRYLKKIRALRQIVSSEAIGKIGFAHAEFFIGPHFGGFRDVMESPLILDMAIHTFDQARFVIGSDPVSVYCHEFNPYGSWYKGNASAVCIFEFSNGEVFNYCGSWCAEGYPTSWESSWRIVGSCGTALWNGFDNPSYQVVIPTTENPFTNKFEKVEVEGDWSGREGHFGCLDEMFAALNEGRKAETDCTDNIKSMAMVFGAIESAKKGCKINIKI